MSGSLSAGTRGSAGQRLIRWCERSDVLYLIGLARNKRLQARVEQAEEVLKGDHARTGASSGPSVNSPTRPVRGAGPGAC